MVVLDADTVIVFPVSDQFEGISLPGFVGRTISIAEENLNTISESLGLPLIEEVVGRSGIAIRCNHNAVVSLRWSLDNVHGAVSKWPALVDHPSLYKELNYNLPAQVLCMLTHSIGKPITLPKLRRQVIRTVRSLIEARQGEVSIVELCRASGVSWRTLDYAFKEHVGVSPKTYLQAYRLNRVRQELTRAPHGLKISDAANYWGFWHLGRFASDYRKLFGELPSETLRRTNNK